MAFGYFVTLELFSNLVTLSFTTVVLCATAEYILEG